jgi:hypothetical protein
MNKEQQELLDESYKNYMKWAEEHSKTHLYEPYTQEEFINKIKTDVEFSEKWGLKIEERELSDKERIELAGGKIQEKYPALIEMSLRICDEREIPTKLITVTYKDKTAESYE